MTPSDIVLAIDSIRYAGFSVPPEYIDRNNHMNIGYYSVIFDKALLRWRITSPTSARCAKAIRSMSRFS